MEELTTALTSSTAAFVVGAAGVRLFVSRREARPPPPPPLREGPLPHVAEVRVRSGAVVDHVAFVMSDGTLCGFGGPGGTARPAFVLQPGEHIAAVEGRSGDYLDQIQFVTSAGRRSEAFGGQGGAPFSLELPDRAPIGGLVVAESARGWIAKVHGLMGVGAALQRSDAMAQAARSAPGFVAHHRTRLRRNTLEIGGCLLTYALLVLAIMAPLLLELLRGPVPLDQAIVAGGDGAAQLARRYVTLEGAREDGSELRGRQSWVEEYRLQGGYLRSGRLQHRWAALEPDDELPAADRTSDDELPAGAVFLQDLECPLFEESETGRKRRLMVKTSRSLEPGNHADMPWVGMITALRSDSGPPTVGGPQQVPKEILLGPRLELPRCYLETAIAPRVLWLLAAAALTVGACGCQLLLSLRPGGEDTVVRAMLHYVNEDEAAADRTTRAQQAEDLIRAIDAEVSEEPDAQGVPQVFTWGSAQVAVTATWVIQASRFGFDVAVIADCDMRLRGVSRQYVNTEQVEVGTIRVQNQRRLGAPSFEIQLAMDDYQRLEASALNRVREAQAAIAAQRNTAFAAEFARILRERQGMEGMAWQLQAEPQPCMGCGRASTVKITKKCDTCPERVECGCEPSWCHHCLLKWWITKNQTRIEMEPDFSPTWQARCPTCRIYFCLNDVMPLANATIEDEDRADDTTDADAAEARRLRAAAAPIAAANDPQRARELQQRREEQRRQDAEYARALAEDNARAEPEPEPAELDDEDEIQRAIAMSLAEEDEQPVQAGAEEVPAEHVAATEGAEQTDATEPTAQAVGGEGAAPVRM